MRGDIRSGEKPEHGNAETTGAAIRGQEEADGRDEGDDSADGKGIKP